MSKENYSSARIGWRVELVGAAKEILMLVAAAGLGWFTAYLIHKIWVLV